MIIVPRPPSFLDTFVANILEVLAMFSLHDLRTSMDISASLAASICTRQSPPGRTASYISSKSIRQALRNILRIARERHSRAKVLKRASSDERMALSIVGLRWLWPLVQAFSQNRRAVKNAV